MPPVIIYLAPDSFFPQGDDRRGTIDNLDLDQRPRTRDGGLWKG